MSSFLQPIFANGLVILATLARIWIVTAIASAIFSMIALVLGFRRQAATAARMLAAIACSIGIIPVILAGLVFLGTGWPRTLFQFGFVALSIFPILVAATALVFSAKRRHAAEPLPPSTPTP